MNKTLYPGLTGEAGKPRRATVMYQVEGLRPLFLQYAGAIDERIVAGEKGGQQLLVADRNVQRHDLPDIAQRLQELGLLGVAAADRNHIAASGESLDDVAPDEARAAEHRGPARSHVVSPWAPPAGAPSRRTLYPGPAEDQGTPSHARAALSYQRVCRAREDEGVGSRRAGRDLPGREAGPGAERGGGTGADRCRGDLRDRSRDPSAWRAGDGRGRAALSQELHDRARIHGHGRQARDGG